jgi:hypothetical protein
MNLDPGEAWTEIVRRPTVEEFSLWTCPAFVESVFDFTLPALRTEAG